MKQGVIKKKGIQYFAVLLVILSMVLGMVQTAWADSFDYERRGSITIHLMDLQTDWSNVTLNLYKVGDPVVTENTVGWNLDERLSSTGIDLNALDTAEEIQTATESLEAVIGDSGIAPITGATDGSGSAVFSGLELGMYLITAPESAYGIVSSSLVSLPSMETGEDGSTTGWLYDLTITPKASIPEEIMGAIHITKNVSDGEKAIKTDDTFYAGIFTSEDQEQTDMVVELKQNGTVEIQVPLGGTFGRDDITYYVKETDAEGVPVDQTTFAYMVTGEGSVELTEEEPEGYVSLSNTLKEQATATPTPTTRPSTSNNYRNTGIRGTSNTGTTSRSPVKTGDETNLTLWFGLLVLAGAAVVIGAKKAARKK